MKKTDSVEGAINGRSRVSPTLGDLGTPAAGGVDKKVAGVGEIDRPTD